MHLRSNVRLAEWILDFLEQLPDSSKAPGAADVVARAERLARERLGHRVSVEDLARAFGFSRSRFTTLYRRSRGCGPGSMLRRIRLDEAQRLLLSTNLRLAEVAACVGLPRASALSKFFRARLGVTPSAWRRQERLRRLQ